LLLHPMGEQAKQCNLLFVFVFFVNFVVN